MRSSQLAAALATLSSSVDGERERTGRGSPPNNNWRELHVQVAPLPCPLLSAHHRAG
jgi:hypothetical protein